MIPVTVVSLLAILGTRVTRDAVLAFLLPNLTSFAEALRRLLTGLGTLFVQIITGFDARLALGNLFVFVAWRLATGDCCRRKD